MSEPVDEETELHAKNQELRDEIEFLQAEVAVQTDVDRPRRRSDGLWPMDKRCADALADEVDVLVRRKVIDSRSPAADALLDYRNEPTTPRSDRLVELERNVQSLEGKLGVACDLVEGILNMTSCPLDPQDSQRMREIVASLRKATT